jgi:hypothetical protein
MNGVIQPAPIRRTLLVPVDVERAFTGFTARIGAWWPRSHCTASAPQADVIIEPRLGGRWYERGADGSECEWGKVLVWEPPTRRVLAWQIDAQFRYDPTLVTEVELRFTALDSGQTQVDFEHRHLERLGAAAAATRDKLDSGWPGILEAYRRIAGQAA